MNRTADAGKSSSRNTNGVPSIAARLVKIRGRCHIAHTTPRNRLASSGRTASGDRARHRLPRGGDRQLNYALHVVALTQVRMRTSAGRRYYDRKISEGKTHNEAMRTLKRRLADHVWQTMITDERAQQEAAGPGGHPGATLKSSAAGPTPTTSSSDKSLPEPAENHPTTSDPAA